MIEIENPGIRLAAVDARMIKQVIAYPTPQLTDDVAASDLDLGNVTFPVPRVPLTGVDPLAQKADPLPRLAFDRAVRKLSQRLCLFTDATGTDAKSCVKSQLDRRRGLWRGTRRVAGEDAMGRRSFACLSSMAVGAPDLALVDLRFDPGPSPTSSRVCGYVGHLLGDVVELEHHDVGLAAVNARVRAEIFDDVFLDFGAPLPDLPYEPRLFAFVVLPIIPGVRLGEAVATPRLELWLTTPHRRKRLERLDLAALRARSHEGERADWSISRE
ncbi:MAG TPA: hypothetical protein VNB51_06910 [Candidatus Udaeobacter sp.]|nr:hypothetical protein [Candidatus Udaeobacter sp.]